MSIQLTLTAMGDFSDVERKQAIAETKNEQIKQALEDNEVQLEKAFNKSIAVMRASYQMFAGVGQMMGTSMGQMFSTLMGVLTAGVATYAAFAATELAKGPIGWVQAALMSANLVTAVISLGALISGQKELANQVSGFNMILSGFGGLLDSMDFG